ncbi:MAG: aspartate carbamoyltransferase [Synergistaceae bacterium]|jgi:aspartate carbamoyltransferase catalytic subunit|nr:aspartate carbamoyltransferase [Synergistaceae bacterium]
MALPKSFSPFSIMEKLEETGLKDRNFEFLTDYTRQQLQSLFEAGEMLEPFWKDKLELMNGKVLATLFFQPSTRTRFSTEVAMVRLGGSVLSESNPTTSSSTAKGESLSDYLRTVSNYADIIALRHPNDKEVFESLGGARVPVISGGWGNVTHPTQGLLDVYTVYRALGRFEGIKVMIASSDLSRARSGHSFALGLAAMGAELLYIGTSENSIPDTILDKLKAAGAKFTVRNDLNQAGFLDSLMEVDVCYLPGCSVPKDDPAARAAFLDKIKPFYITLDMLQKVKSKTSKVVGIMHSLPRNDVEFDYAIDDSEFQLYFRQMAFSVPIRMALIAGMVGV